MKKKNLKWYEAPQVEVVEMEMEKSVLLAESQIEGTPDTDHGNMDK